MKSLILAVPVFAAVAASNATGWIGVIAALGGLIFIHELGHFLVAKWMGLPVEVFSLGFGPRLVGFKWRETDVRLSALPLGGYVKLLGFNPEDPEADDPYGFQSQPTWKRQLFFAGGIIFNVLTAFIVLWGIGTARARVTQVELHGVMAELKSDYPAAAAGLKDGDEVISVGGIRIQAPNDWDKAIAFIQARPGQAIPLELTIDGQFRRMDVVAKNDGGIGRLGFIPFITEVPTAWRPFEFKDLGTGIRFASVMVPYQSWRILVGYGRLISGKESLKNVGGPGTIGKMAFKAAQSGLIHFLSFLAFLSLNLAVLNALPIPFLDGGHMAILGLEKLRGRDLSLVVKERILTSGLVLLGSLMIFVIALDIWRLKH